LIKSSKQGVRVQLSSRRRLINNYSAIPPCPSLSRVRCSERLFSGNVQTDFILFFRRSVLVFFAKPEFPVFNPRSEARLNIDCLLCLLRLLLIYETILNYYLIRYLPISQSDNLLKSLTLYAYIQNTGLCFICFGSLYSPITLFIWFADLLLIRL
jgi:hypothetical protein